MPRPRSGEDTGHETRLPEAEGLRVAIFSDAAPDRNGVGTYYRDLTEHLKAAGAQVDLIAPRFRRGTWYGGFALPLPGDSTQKILFPLPWLISRRMRRFAPHSVVVPTPGPYGLLGMHLARRRGTNLIIGFHTHFERLVELYGGSISARINHAYLTMSNRLLFRYSNAVLANSDHMVAVAREIGAQNVGLMGTPICKRFLDAPTTPLRRELSRILFAGRLAPEKNLESVVEAAREHPGLEVIVVGDGPQREWLRREAARLPNLRYLGWVKRSKLLPLIDGVDAVVLPSKVESFGTIALEAMARGRIVLVSGACGIVDWASLSQGLYPIHPDERLSDALTRVAALDPAVREGKARIGREAAREINDWNLRHWLSVLRQPALAQAEHP